MRAMVYIAEKAGQGYDVVSAKSIAESQGISENYLEQIIAVLKNKGYLRSVRGAGGGYALTKPPQDITAGEVLRSLEGTLSPAECLDEQGDTQKSQSSCGSCENCVAKNVMSRVYSSVTEVVDSISILDILNDVKTNKDIL